MINLADYNPKDGRVFTGRAHGEQLRTRLNLDQDDQTDGLNVTVIVPANTLSLNSSFFLGLFGPSVRTLGKDGFYTRYTFEGPDRVRRNVETGVRRALLTSNPID